MVDKKRESVRLQEGGQRRVLDGAARQRRLARQLDALEMDNFQEDPHSPQLLLAGPAARLPSFQDPEQPGRKRKKLRGDHFKLRFRKTFQALLEEELLFGRIEGAKRARHGLEKRWSDVVQEDVELSGLADDWYQRCQDRPQWRRLVKDATGQLEAVALQQQRRAEERRSQQRAERRVAKAQQVGTVGGTGGASASHLGHLGQSTRGTWRISTGSQ
ncbi:uncharacterized protein LOC144952371 [Lampetra fluviatilis]